MKSVYSLVSLLMVTFSCVTFTAAFAPQTGLATRAAVRPTKIVTMGFLGDQERDSLTRDSEPEEFFQTNTDKMSDAEKLPIALAGVAFITLPFIAGLIALYSAK